MQKLWPVAEQDESIAVIIGDIVKDQKTGTESDAETAAEVEIEEEKEKPMTEQWHKVLKNGSIARRITETNIRTKQDI